MTKKKALYLVSIEWEQDGRPVMTAQTGRDKIFDALAEMWKPGHLTSISIERVDTEHPIPKLSRRRTK